MSNLIQEPFKTYKLGEREDAVKVRFNKEERAELEEWKKCIDMDRDTTAIKMAILWALGDIKPKVKDRYRVKILRKKH
tara:strand:+ start:177 stop:410 length:234 start_codon:yes stop_codon:yes gene_type:complete